MPFAPRDRSETGERRGDRRPPRGTRPQSGERQQRGERPARSQGERAPRGERSTQGGERTPRAPRAQGERPARQTGERPTRSRRTESTAEEAPVVQETQNVAENQTPAVQDIQETTLLKPRMLLRFRRQQFRIFKRLRHLKLRHHRHLHRAMALLRASRGDSKPCYWHHHDISTANSIAVV